MKPNELNLTQEILGHTRFHFITYPANESDPALIDGLEAIERRMENMHVMDGNPTAEAYRRGRYQYLRAEPGEGGVRDIPHPEMSGANFLIHTESSSSGALLSYEEVLRALIENRGGSVETLSGIRKPRSYTSFDMTQYAYARALPPGSGARLPIGVVTPQNKTKDWWKMNWMRRESFFLPRYDAEGKIIEKGHALASEAGIPCINRRLVHNPDGYGQKTGYDFVGYFEFAEEDADTFRSVMAELRNKSDNPEWNYVREGPEWWGRRVARSRDLWKK